MTGFVPSGYISHEDALRHAYLSIYGPIVDDPEVYALVLARELQRSILNKRVTGAAIRATSVNVNKRTIKVRPATGDEAGTVVKAEQLKPEATPEYETQALRIADEPLEFIMGDYGDLGRGRKLAVRDTILDKLSEGRIRGFSPVVLSTSAIGFHRTLRLPMPKAVDPIVQLGIWSTPAGANAIFNGSIVWAFSEYDRSVEARPLFFLKAEIAANFRERPSINATPIKNKAQRLAPIMRGHWPNKQDCPSLSQALPILEADDEVNFSVKRDAFYAAKKLAYPD